MYTNKALTFEKMFAWLQNFSDNIYNYDKESQACSAGKDMWYPISPYPSQNFSDSIIVRKLTTQLSAAESVSGW